LSGGNAVQPSRRQLLHLAAGAATLPAVSRVAGAENYPSRPVRLLVGFAAGGASDVIARLLAQQLSDRLGQSVIVENRTGAGTNIATEAVVRAPPDGYTLLVITHANAINATLYASLPFDFMRDIAPVARIGQVSEVMVVNPSFPAQTLAEFIAYAKANPRKVNFASAGAGSMTHISGVLFDMLVGTELVHVPYRGEAPAMSDLLGGQVQVMFPSTTLSMAYIKAGTVRPLAVTSAARWDALPDLPTVAELVPGYEATAWHGIGAPKGTPDDIVDTLNRAVNAALADPTMKARFANVDYALVPMTRSDFAKFVTDETERWRKVIRAAGIKAG
jgi:tripartite-type tricarboxylate transporter receptor subunit TctC